MSKARAYVPIQQIIALLTMFLWYWRVFYLPAKYYWCRWNFVLSRTKFAVRRENEVQGETAVDSSPTIASRKSILMVITSKSQFPFGGHSPGKIKTQYRDRAM